MPELSGAAYADLFGPTTGDRIRLADTDLLVEIEEDRSGGPGRSGRRSRLRRRQGAARVHGPGPHHPRRGRTRHRDHRRPDHRPLGRRQGRHRHPRRPRITGIEGEAGNPDTMDGVHPDLVIGPDTEIIAGNGKILTAGAASTPTSTSSRPALVDQALASSGITTLVGGGAGPGRGHQGDHRHPRPLAPTPGCSPPWRPTPSTSGCLGKGSTTSHDVHARPTARRSPRLQDPRGLGSHPRRHRRLPARSARRPAPSSPSTPTPSTRPVSSATPSPRSRGAPCTRSTWRVRAAGTRPTSSPSSRSRTSCRARPTRPGRTPSTPSRNTSTC
ncbi:Urease subunit alpha [Streptomyces microflavus]